MGFNDGDVMTGANVIIFEMQIEGQWLRWCPNSLNENLNLAISTWRTLCDNVNNNAITGADPDWGGDIIVPYNSSVASFLRKRFDYGYLQNIPIRITNLLLNERLQFMGMISALSQTYTAADMVTASFTVKVGSGSVVTTEYEDGTFENINFVMMDTSNNLVPNTKVTLVNSDTGLVVSATSKVDGTGLLGLVPIGDYSLSFDNFPLGLTPPTDLTLTVTAGMALPVVWTFTVGAPEQPTIDIDVTKSWTDPQPTNSVVTVNLLDAELNIVNSIDLDDTGFGTFTSVPSMEADGVTPIVYTITETLDDGAGNDLTPDWDMVVTGDQVVGFTITNSLVTTP